MTSHFGLAGFKPLVFAVFILNLLLNPQKKVVVQIVILRFDFWH